MIDPCTDLGERTKERLKSNRTWLLARFIDQLIYEGTTAIYFAADANDKPGTHGYERFATSAAGYNCERLADVLRIPHEKGRLKSEVVLRHVMHELERIAVKEVT